SNNGVGIQDFAEIPRPFQGSWKSVHKPGIHGAVIIEAVKIKEPKGLAQLRDWAADRKSPVVLTKREGGSQASSLELGTYKIIRGIEFIVRIEVVNIAVESAASRLCRVSNESAAGMSILRRESIFDDRHFLHRWIGNRAFLGLLMAFCISKSGTVKPVLGRHGLATVD